MATASAHGEADLLRKLARFRSLSHEGGGLDSYLRWGVMPSAAQPAFALCERALEIDGHNVRALAIFAIRSQVRVINFISDDPSAELRRADELSTRALALDPNNYLSIMPGLSSCPMAAGRSDRRGRAGARSQSGAS